jgi:membrane protease YdiL (CAAX protease family)
MQAAEQVTEPRFQWVSGHAYSVLQQVSAVQSKLPILLLCLFVPTWLPTLVAHGLLLWSSFSRFVSQHNSAYCILFFVVQFSLICCAVTFLTRTYGSAVWMTQPRWRCGIPIAVFILLPLLAFHLYVSARGMRAIIALSNLGDAGNQVLSGFYRQIWGQLAYGSSGTGVVCSSLLSFVSPVLEEIVFSGFVVNAISRRYGLTAAAFGAPACFAMCHALQFGIGPHLIVLYMAGTTYTMIRIFSGSLLLAVFAHWMINAVIFVPKWVLAALYFARL